MLCEVALFGEVKLPDASLDTFLTAQVWEAALPGIPLDALQVLPRSSEAALEELKSWPLLAPEWLKVELENGRLEVRGLVSRDTFLTVGPSLASLCRTAALHGAGGTLLMVGLGPLSFGYSTRCAYGRATVRTLRAEAVAELRESDAVQALRAGARASLEVLLGDGAGAPFTGAP